MLITDYLDQLDIDKDTLYNNLVNAGISASQDETFTTLCPKVGELTSDLKDELKPSINLTGANITDEPLSEYPEKLNEGLMNVLNNGTDVIFNNYPNKETKTNIALTFDNTIEAPIKIKINGNIAQIGNPTPTNPKEVLTVSGNNNIWIQNEDYTQRQDYPINLGVENLWNRDKLLTGFLPSTGSYPTTDAGWPNAKYFLIPIKANQEVHFKNCNDPSGRGVLRYIDITTNEVVGSIERVENTYFNSTKDFSAGFPSSGIVIAKVDFIIGLMVKDSTSTFSCDITYRDQYISENPIELCRIGDVTNPNYDYIYKQNNKWYVHKEIGKVILDGSEIWEKGNDDGDRYYFFTASLDSQITGTTGISNYFPIGYSSSGSCINLTLAYAHIRVFILKTLNIDSIADFQTWLSTHNTVVYYVLATPKEIEITDYNLIYQLEAMLNNSKSYVGTTYINPIVWEGANINVEATALKEGDLNG